MARYLVSDINAAVALDLAKQVEEKKISRATAFNHLIEQHGFKAYTANAYINCYSHLRAGTGWKATISEAALRMMLNEIAAKGENELFRALRAAQSHIEYFAARGSNLLGLKEIVREYQAHLAARAQLMPSAEVLGDQVKAAAADSPSERRARLAAAPVKPMSTIRLVRDFSRNPDVIAEVLYRAGGVCEGCQSPAPFNRRANGSPYLEVHHKVRLADDGDDTVENAIALCPNCHRQQHYG